MTAKPIIIHPSNSLPPSQQGIKTLPESTTFLIINFVILSTLALIYVCASKQSQHFSSFKLPPKTPCHRCRYFSNNQFINCALHPVTALTEQAVDCKDYCPNSWGRKVE